MARQHRDWPLAMVVALTYVVAAAPAKEEPTEAGRARQLAAVLLARLLDLPARGEEVEIPTPTKWPGHWRGQACWSKPGWPERAWFIVDLDRGYLSEAMVSWPPAPPDTQPVRDGMQRASALAARLREGLQPVLFVVEEPQARDREAWYRWQGRTDGVLTGASVTVLADSPLRRPALYAEYRPPAEVPKPVLDRDAAALLARGYAARPGVAVRVLRGELYLATYWAPREGPAWFFSLQDAADESARTIPCWVDAVTGKKLVRFEPDDDGPVEAP